MNGGIENGKSEKSDLKPGIKVRNTVSGSVSEIFVPKGIDVGDLGFASWCVGICRRIATGMTAGKYDYPIWQIENLKLVS